MAIRQEIHDASANHQYGKYQVQHVLAREGDWLTTDLTRQLAKGNDRGSKGNCTNEGANKELDLLGARVVLHWVDNRCNCDQYCR